MNQRAALGVSFLVLVFSTFVVHVGKAAAQGGSSSPSSSSASSIKHVKKPAAAIGSELDAGSVSENLYRNKMLGISYKIPEGWVLRTDELNERSENDTGDSESSPQRTRENTETDKNTERERVLLAAFSRPPEAKGEEVNSSVLIAVESAAAYPGLKEAAQYFEPLTEVAKAQGFTEDEEPYEIAVGGKTLVRVDFHRDVGTRVMRQSTLAMLSHGYAVSITVIAGTEDDVEELVDGLTFTVAGK